MAVPLLIIGFAVVGAFAWLLSRSLRRSRKPARPATAASGRIQAQLLDQENWSFGWLMYQFILGLPAETRAREGDLVEAVARHFDMSPNYARSCLARLRLILKVKLLVPGF